MAALTADASVGIAGAGTMGRGVAITAATAGHLVRLIDTGREQTEQALAAIASELDRRIGRGRLDAASAAAIRSRITAADSLADLASSALVLEAIPEDFSAKTALLRSLAEIVAPDAVIATNTSSLSITALARGLPEIGRVLGLHFFNPVPAMPLVEVVSGRDTRAEVADAAAALMARWGKVPVRVGDTPGFIVNRVNRPYFLEALRIVEDGGADPATIDALLVDCAGFRMGPFATMDLIGIDVSLDVAVSLYDAFFHDPRYRPCWLERQQVAAGRLGRKSWRGWFDYGEGTGTAKPTDAPPGPRPQAVAVEGEAGKWSPLLDRLRDAGIALRYLANDFGPLKLYVGETLLMPSDGRMASAIALDEEAWSVVQFDSLLDPAKATRIAIAAAEQAPDDAVANAVGLFQAAGFTVNLVGDIPGMVIGRILAMVINEAADLVLKGIAAPEDIDQAMILGAGYPQGPLAWGDAEGAASVLSVLDQVRIATGDERARASMLLRRTALAKGTLLG